MNLRFADRGGAFEEVEVAALVGLRDVTGVEVAVAAGIGDLARLPLRAPRRQLLVGHPQRQPPRRDVELDDVAVPDERQRPADERLRRDVQHARAVAGAAHPRVGDAHHVADALLQQLLRDRQHPPLGHAGTAERTRVLQHQHRIGRHRQRRIVDPRREIVVVLEHHRGTRVLEQPALRRGVLDDGAVGREIAAQHRDAPLGPDRRARAARSPRRCRPARPSSSSAQRPPGDGEAVGVEQIAQAIEHAAQAAGVVEVLHQELAGRPDVREERRAPRQRVEAIQIQRRAGASRHRDEMDDRVGRSAERHRRRHRVLERLGRQDVARRQVFPHHLDDAAAGRGGHARMRRVGRRNRRRAGQRQAQRVHRRRHRRRRAHRHAGAERARDAVFHLAPGAVVEQAGALLVPVLPDVGARAEDLPAPVAAQHRPGGHEDRRQVRAGRAHHQRRDGLVAAAEQDDAVGGVGAQRFLGVHREQVAIEHRARLHERLAERQDRDLHREAAGLPDAALDVLGAHA